MRKERRDREHHRYVKPPTGELGLWQAVLGRQIRDAFGTSRGQKERAMIWLFSDSPAFVESRRIVCELANVNWDCWQGQLLGFIKSMNGCDYILLDGQKMNGRECAKYICKMIARAGND